MAELKTKKTEQSVQEFLVGVADEKQRKDCYTILEMMQKQTKAAPKMWGSNVVGFGDYRYQYKSGREGDWFLTGFSPRKQNLTLYLMGGLSRHAESLAQLGKHKIGKGCLYINSLEEVNLEVLESLIQQSVEAMQSGNVEL